MTESPFLNLFKSVGNSIGFDLTSSDRDKTSAKDSMEGDVDSAVSKAVGHVSDFGIIHMVHILFYATHYYRGLMFGKYGHGWSSPEQQHA